MSADALKWWSRLKLGGIYNMNANDYRVMDVLAYQHHMGDDQTMVFNKSRLAQLCDMDRRSLSRSVENLTKNGWIERDKNRPGYAMHYSIPRFENYLERKKERGEIEF